MKKISSISENEVKVEAEIKVESEIKVEKNNHISSLYLNLNLNLNLFISTIYYSS